MTREEYEQRRKNGESKEQIISSWQAEKDKKAQESVDRTGVTPEEWQAYAQYLNGSEKHGSGSNYYTSVGQDLWVQAYVTAQQAAEEMGLDPSSKAGKMFIDEYQNRVLQNSPDYANTMSLRDSEREREKAEALKQQTIAENQRVADFSAAMQQYDPTTGMAYSDLTPQSAIADAKSTANGVADWFRQGTQGFRDRLQQDREYDKEHPPQRWESVKEWFNYGR